MAITFLRGTRLADFWKGLPDGAEEALLDLPYDGRKGEQVSFVPGVGSVATYVDACSEGEDRGGYVKYARLVDVLVDGEPVLLEEDGGEGTFLFEPRMTEL